MGTLEAIIVLQGVMISLQAISVVIAFWGTNFSSRAWQIPVIGRALQNLMHIRTRREDS